MQTRITDQKQTTIIIIFLWVELIHYLLGAVGCAFMPQEIPANYFPVGVGDCEGARYIIRGVLAPFYVMTALSILETIRDRTNTRGLCIRMSAFFLALMLGDALSFMDEWEHWTVNKMVDASVHVSLAFIYCSMLSMGKSDEDVRKGKRDEGCIKKKKKDV